MAVGTASMLGELLMVEMPLKFLILTLQQVAVSSEHSVSVLRPESE
jgi:hypothetical protein